MRKISFGFVALFLISAGMLAVTPFVVFTLALILGWAVVAAVWCQKNGKWEEVREHLRFWEREDG